MRNVAQKSGLCAPIKIDPDFAEAHNQLGIVLCEKGDFAAGVREFQAALKINPKLSSVHKNLRKVALTHFNLGNALIDKGNIEGAIGEYQAAARLFGDIFAAEPKFAQDIDAGHRYNAARAAALAGCGQGKDISNAESDRARLRHHALDWLRADLAAYRQQIEKGLTKPHPLVLERMRDWQSNNDFAGVRGSEALARLPESERLDWKTLWEDVALLRKRAGEQFGQLWDDLQNQVGHSRHRFIESKHEGSLTAMNKKQIHTVEIKAGKTYVLDLESKAFDTFLILEGGADVKLAENDDISSSNLNSRIIYSPQKTGTYRVIATCFGPDGNGPYVLRIRELVDEK